jgi:hypothetical protein
MLHTWPRFAKMLTRSYHIVYGDRRRTSPEFYVGFHTSQVTFHSSPVVSCAAIVTLPQVTKLFLYRRPDDYLGLFAPIVVISCYDTLAPPIFVSIALVYNSWHASLRTVVTTLIAYF